MKRSFRYPFRCGSAKAWLRMFVARTARQIAKELLPQMEKEFAQYTPLFDTLMRK